MTCDEENHTRVESRVFKAECERGARQRVGRVCALRLRPLSRTAEGAFPAAAGRLACTREESYLAVFRVVLVVLAGRYLVCRVSQSVSQLFHGVVSIQLTLSQYFQAGPENNDGGVRFER